MNKELCGPISRTHTHISLLPPFVFMDFFNLLSIEEVRGPLFSLP